MQHHGKERHPLALGHSPVTLNFAVDDVDGVCDKAVQAGCKFVM